MANEEIQLDNGPSKISTQWVDELSTTQESRRKPLPLRHRDGGIDPKTFAAFKNEV